MFSRPSHFSVFLYLIFQLTRLLESIHQQTYFPLLLVAALTVPVQGLPNFLVYYRPFYQRWRSQRPVPDDLDFPSRCYSCWYKSLFCGFHCCLCGTCPFLLVRQPNPNPTLDSATLPVSMGNTIPAAARVSSAPMVLPVVETESRLDSLNQSADNEVPSSNSR